MNNKLNKSLIEFSKYFQYYYILRATPPREVLLLCFQQVSSIII